MFVVDVGGVKCPDLDVFVLVEGGMVDHTLEQDGVSKYRVTFVPTQLGTHTVIVYAGGGKVRGTHLSYLINTSLLNILIINI